MLSSGSGQPLGRPIERLAEASVWRGLHFYASYLITKIPTPVIIGGNSNRPSRKYLKSLKATVGDAQVDPVCSGKVRPAPLSFPLPSAFLPLTSVTVLATPFSIQGWFPQMPKGPKRKSGTLGVSVLIWENCLAGKRSETFTAFQKA